MMNPTDLRTPGFTWAHEFSQAIIFLSPITVFADEYKYYLDGPLKDLFQEVPTVWDETRVLPRTEIGEIVAYARRKGNSSWIGVMNGAELRKVPSFIWLPGQAGPPHTRIR